MLPDGIRPVNKGMNWRGEEFIEFAKDTIWLNPNDHSTEDSPKKTALLKPDSKVQMEYPGTISLISFLKMANFANIDFVGQKCKISHGRRHKIAELNIPALNSARSTHR